MTPKDAIATSAREQRIIHLSWNAAHAGALEEACASCSANDQGVAFYRGQDPSWRVHLHGAPAGALCERCSTVMAEPGRYRICFGCEEEQRARSAR